MAEPWLDPGERVLWRGRPSVAPLRATDLLPWGILAVLMVVFAFEAAGLVALAAVPCLMLALVLGDLSKRLMRHVLTDRRCVHAVDWPPVGPDVRSWPVTAGMPVHVDEAAGAVCSGIERHYHATLSRAWTVKRPAGFVDIPDAASVAALLAALRDARRAQGSA